MKNKERKIRAILLVWTLICINASILIAIHIAQLNPSIATPHAINITTGEENLGIISMALLVIAFLVPVAILSLRDQ